jgi:glycosyltransferase involved in cell wall biosynthesis
LLVSIVIAAWNGVPSLERCLRSLEGQGSGMEILAVTNFDVDAARLTRAFPGVRFLAMPEGTTVPRLRAEGIRQAQGDIIALAEDHCTFDPGWCGELVEAHRSAHTVIGGAVENGDSRSALAWAVYFYDYGKFMLPFPAAPAAALSGNNVSYKRAALLAVEPTFREGLFEPFTHGELVRRGHELYLTPKLVVYHQKSYRLGEAAAQAYYLARDYAAKRVRGTGFFRRAGFVAGSLALTLILPGRILVRTLRKGRLSGELLGCLHCLVVLTTSWAFGEFHGYLAGSGTSTGKWR